MSGFRWCIRQKQKTYQAGVTMPLWSIMRVKGIGPLFDSFAAANDYLQSIKPRAK